MNRYLQLLRTGVDRWLRHRWFVPACIVGGVLLRLLWIWLSGPRQVSDYIWYYERGVDIAAGEGYAVNGVPTGFWPIGYPGFLGGLFYVFGPSVLVGQLANVVLYVATILLTYQISKRLFRSESAARITLCILCFYPNHIAYSAILSSEIPFVFLVALSAVTFMAAQEKERTDLLLVSGLFWGLATLTKPQTLLVPLIFLLVFYKGVRPLLKSCVVLYSVLLLTLVPWLVRNYVVVGAPTLAHTAGINLLDGNNPYANGRHNITEDVNAMLGDLKVLKSTGWFDGKEVERDRRAREIAIEYILNHPGHVLSLLPRKFFYLFRSDVDGTFYSLGVSDAYREGRYRALYFGSRVIAQLYYIFMIVLFLVSVPVLVRNKVRVQWIGVGIVAYFTLIYLVMFGNARYHFPMMPWLAIYSGVGAQVLLFGRSTLRQVPGEGGDLDREASSP